MLVLGYTGSEKHALLIKMWKVNNLAPVKRSLHTYCSVKESMRMTENSGMASSKIKISLASRPWVGRVDEFVFAYIFTSISNSQKCLLLWRVKNGILQFVDLQIPDSDTEKLS